MTLLPYRFRIYVGPVWVDQYAANARAAGMVDVFEGTEHVHGTILAEKVTTETDRLVLKHTIANAVYNAQMTTGWRDVTLLREG
jgi:hypothetical protein